MNGKIAHHIHYGWDFSQITRSGAAMFVSKKDAREFAKTHGWMMKNIHRGYSQWAKFYFVGQMVSPTEWRILKKDHTAENHSILVIEYDSNITPYNS
jgi:hypothetical protein